MCTSQAQQHKDTPESPFRTDFQARAPRGGLKRAMTIIGAVTVPSSIRLSETVEKRPVSGSRLGSGLADASVQETEIEAISSMN